MRGGGRYDILKRLWRRLALAILLLCGLGMADSGMAQSVGDLMRNAAAAQQLIGRAEREGEVRVIVEFKAEFSRESHSSGRGSILTRYKTAWLSNLPAVSVSGRDTSVSGKPSSRMAE